MATHSSILTWKIREAWWATVYRVAKSQTWLKWLSTHVRIVDWVLLINNVTTISGGSERTQPYIFIYPFSPNIPSYPDCHRINFCVCFFVYKCYLSLQNSRFTKKCPLSQKYPFGNFMINRKNCAGTIRKPLEKEMATHSSILAGRIPRTEEPGRQDLWLNHHHHDMKIT